MWTEILSLEACLLLVCGKSFVSVLHLSRSKAGLTGPQPPSLIPGSSSTFLQANLLIFFGLLRTTNGSTCHLVLVRKSESSCGWHVAAYENFGCPGSRTCPLCCACQCPIHPTCLRFHLSSSMPLAQLECWVPGVGSWTLVLLAQKGWLLGKLWQ